MVECFGHVLPPLWPDDQLVAAWFGAFDRCHLDLEFGCAAWMEHFFGKKRVIWNSDQPLTLLSNIYIYLPHVFVHASTTDFFIPCRQPFWMHMIAQCNRNASSQRAPRLHVMTPLPFALYSWRTILVLHFIGAPGSNLRAESHADQLLAILRKSSRPFVVAGDRSRGMRRGRAICPCTTPKRGRSAIQKFTMFLSLVSLQVDRTPTVSRCRPALD